MIDKFAQGMPPPPMPPQGGAPMDPNMMAMMAQGGMPPPPPPAGDPGMMPPPAAGMPPPPPYDPSMMMGAPAGMPADPSAMGMPPPPAEGAAGLDPNAPPEAQAAAGAELDTEDLRQDVRTMAQRINDLEKSTSNIERLVESVANHIGISTGATGSRKGEEGDDAEKSAGLEYDEIEQMKLVEAGLRKYAASLLAQAQGAAEQE